MLTNVLLFSGNGVLHLNEVNNPSEKISEPNEK